MGKLLLAALLLLPCTLAINIRGGDINLVRPDSPYIDYQYVPPEYLSVEDLVFYTCIEEDLPVKSTVICLDDNSFRDVVTTRWLEDENCYIASYDLDEKDCRQMLIQSEYVKDDEIVTLQQPVKVNRLSSILDLVTRNQYSDGGWKDAVHTAAGIWVLSNYRQIYDDELKLGIDWLKLNRDNDEKCWPRDSCSVRTTAKILAYLTLSGYNDTSRIMHDGEVYLRNMQNFYQDGDTWDLTIAPFEPGNTSCVISYENLLNEGNFVMEQGKQVNYSISPVPGNELIVVCDQNFKANLTAIADDRVFIYEGDNLTYTTPENCWSADGKWGDCDIPATLYASMTNITDINRELALDFLEKQLQVTRAGEKTMQYNINDSAMYVFLTGDEDVTSWLRYKQNNEGSWGNRTNMANVIPTGLSLLGLLATGFNRTDEVIEDAEKWVNEKELEFTLNITEDYVAWNSTEMNAHAFIVLKNNARPILKSDPAIVLIDKEVTDVEIYNPTTFDLNEISFEFSDNLKDILQIEDEDFIPAYSYVRQAITKVGVETGDVYGYLSVYDYDDELGRIPVMITDFPDIKISYTQDNLVVFGAAAKVDFSIAKTGHKFNCKLAWDEDDISSQSDYTVDSNTLSVDVSFDSAERAEKTYVAEFTCTSNGYDFVVPVDVRMSRYKVFPFTVEPVDLFLNESGRDATFAIENKLDETLDVEAKFLKTSDYFELSRNSFAIDPNTKINITVYNSAPSQLNISSPNIIEVSALGQTREINFRADIIALPPKKANPVLFWSIVLLIIAGLGAGGYYGYKYKDGLLKLLKKGGKVDQIKMKIKQLEEKEKNTAILNMVNIMRILKKDDVQIRARLKTEGFSEDEINQAMSADEDEGNEDGLPGK